MRTRARVALMVAAFAGVMGPITQACSDNVFGLSGKDDFEVWVMDQSPSPGKTYGGRIFIYQDSVLPSGVHTLAVVPEIVDFAGATASLCQAATGALPVQAHNITFNAAHTHAIIAFLASGHVAILDAATRAPVACLQMSLGATGMRHAHQAVASSDGRYILVANQMGKLVERIDANFRTNAFTLNTAATLDLATCQTPSGAACEAAGVRPNNQPVTFTISEGGDRAFVTMRGGGFFAIDPRTTPMQIRAEYDATTIQPQGLASVRAGNSLFSTSGANAFRLYRFSLSDFAGDAVRAVNHPAPTTLASETGTSRDGHGIMVSPNTRFLWATDRGGNAIEIFDIASGAHVNTLNVAGSFSADPAPDLLAAAPTGDIVFLTMKGPNPLSGAPWGTGANPGVAVIALDNEGGGGHMIDLRAITNRDAGGVERADPHGLAVRRR